MNEERLETTYDQLAAADCVGEMSDVLSPQATLRPRRFSESELKRVYVEEAVELALGREAYNVDWTCDDYGGCGEISVCCVEVENPPEDTILIEQGYCQCGANLNAIIDPDPPETTGDGITEG